MAKYCPIVNKRVVYLECAECEEKLCKKENQYTFDPAYATNHIVSWIRNWFEENGSGCNAVIGISGGKDSTITARLCVEALGKDRVIGVLLPAGNDADEKTAERVVEYLGIKSYKINIGDILSAFYRSVHEKFQPSVQSKTNLPPRVRMSMLYFVSQTHNGRVANTCNLSEDYVGYSTRYGDSVGDFSPLSNYTVHEIRQIGDYLQIPKEFVYKTPADGLCGKTDEDNLGFTYEVLDEYIRTGICRNKEVKEKIDALHQKNQFKLELMPSCPYKG